MQSLISLSDMDPWLMLIFSRCYSMGICRCFDTYFHTFRIIYNSYLGFHDIICFLLHALVMYWCLNKGNLLSG